MNAFKSYVGEEVFPGAAVQSDEQIEEYIRNVRMCVLNSVGVNKVRA